MDAVTAGLTTRYSAVKRINSQFSFLWQYLKMSKPDLKLSSQRFVYQYGVDVSEELVQEMSDLRAIHVANFGEEQLHPIDLLNNLQKTKLQTLFPNCCIALCSFCTLPVTLAEGEHSFSKLKLVKNYLRSTMNQDRLTDLGTLAIESSFARKVNFANIIDNFAQQKARKAHL